MPGGFLILAPYPIRSVLAQLSTPGATEDSILLVEEYDALAAAIGSALRKFAPGHLVQRTRSLAEAEEALLSSRPALVVIDFDPPLPGAIEFLSRAKEVLPNNQFLILTADTPPAIVRGRTEAALQFIVKPFELADFGGTVARLLTTSSGFEGPSSRTQPLELADLVALHCLARITTILKVQEPGGRHGEVHFARGQVRHATAGRFKGSEAVQEMMAWNAARFSMIQKRAEEVRSIEDSWQTVFADALASKPISEGRVTPPLPSPAASKAPAARPKPAKDGKKILIIDDTETLRVFVEEMLGAANPTLRIAKAGDATEGIAQTMAMSPDLILLDYSLPDFNGDEVCRRLLEEPKTARIPVIMMSGHVAEMVTTEARFENVIATIAKPFLSAALIEVVEKSLREPPDFRPRFPAAKEKLPDLPVPKPKSNGGTRPHRKNGKQGTSSALHVAEPAHEEQAGEPAPLPSLPSLPAPLAPAPSAPPLRLVPPPAQVIAFPAQPQWPVLTPARFAAAGSGAVVVGLPLEVVSMQFSSALQMAAIRARPCSRTVALHADMKMLAGTAMPEAGFQLDRVDLDTRGQIQMLRLTPSPQRIVVLAPQAAVPIGGVMVLSSNEGGAVQLMPTARAAMKMQLLASFELAGVELAPDFTVSHLILKARGGKMRVSLQPEAANTGALFESAQVLLDRSARIAEILLDAVA